MSMEAVMCKISLGQFTGEYAVQVTTFDGGTVSLFVSEKFLDFESPPSEGSAVDAKITVELIDTKDNLCLVRLPEPTLENGQTITVKDDLVLQDA